MDYYSLSGSCLFSILIPVNFMVGCYTFFLKEKGVKKRCLLVTDCCIFTIALVYSWMCIRRKLDLYVPFIITGGVLLAIIQSRFCYRKVQKRIEGLSCLEILIKKTRILCGIVIIILPHFTAFQNYILKDVR